MEENKTISRGFRVVKVRKDLVVVGAGMPGIVASIQAARLGLKVALINDRGYLGGNASAEIGVGIAGALGDHEFNFYSREGGIIQEILIENLYKNPSGNRYRWDALLREFIKNEPNIELFLETYIDTVTVNNSKIISVSGSQRGSETRFVFEGDYFIDNTGDGTVGALAGAEYRYGREAKSEFNERIAPDKADEGVLPSTLTFYAKDIGRPVKYIPPDFAIKLKRALISKDREIPKDSFYSFQWYYEIGTDGNVIYDNPKIIDKHYALVYGIWDYVKNRGRYNAGNYDLEYVSCIPGKRESRRLIGDYILTENDIRNQTEFKDVVGHGGWPIDLHAIQGFFSKEPPNHSVYLKGIYQIPFRCGYSRNIKNLMFCGRCMSTTHVAFGSTRVMATLSTLGQATGAAAYLCKKYGVYPRDIYRKHIEELQQILVKTGQYVPGVKFMDEADITTTCKVSASSYALCRLPKTGGKHILQLDTALILPVKEKIGVIKLKAMCNTDTELKYKVYMPDKEYNYSPDIEIKSGVIKLKSSKKFKWINIPVNRVVKSGKIFLKLIKNPQIILAVTNDKLPGVITLQAERNRCNRIIDIETLKPKKFLWRQLGYNLCFDIEPQENIYGPEMIKNGFNRPYKLPNIWVSKSASPGEYIDIEMGNKVKIAKLILYFDPDYNRKIENLKFQDIRIIPTIVKEYEIFFQTSGGMKSFLKIKDNYKAINEIDMQGIETDKIRIKFYRTNGAKRFHLYSVVCYAKGD